MIKARSPLNKESHNRIRETFRRILHDYTTLAERICTLFQVKQHLQTLGRALAKARLLLPYRGSSAILFFICEHFGKNRDLACEKFMGHSHC